MYYNIYSSANFTWKGKRGSVEASELDGSEVRYDYRALGRGFFVRSVKTGTELFFTDVPDEDGYDGECAVYNNGDIYITIFND